MEYVGIKQATEKGYIECRIGGVADFSYPTSKFRRGRVQGGGGISPTITTTGGICRVTKQNIDDYLVDEFGIFDLTERECLRLMGVNDELIDKMAEVNSRTQLYKQAGNSIVVTVLMAIFSQLNIKGVTPWNELTQDQREELVQRTK